jgi:hypothetical protein
VIFSCVADKRASFYWRGGRIAMTTIATRTINMINSMNIFRNTPNFQPQPNLSQPCAFKPEIFYNQQKPVARPPQNRYIHAHALLTLYLSATFHLRPVISAEAARRALKSPL